ncbi:hypothetical protein [Photobacterium minamisatsumaniensis]|uniref:hypothetical protein n=1 Tax=Photobacterium minamisatsumaniensis TaxID=2910233 RepID=UPI003D0F5CA2
MGTLLIMILGFSSVSAREVALRQDIAFGDDIKYVSTIAEGFDCSVLYHDDDAENLAYCFDDTSLFNLNTGLYSAHFIDGKVKRVEYRAPLSLANYNSILAGLRRQNYVFAKLHVADEKLDVLASLQVLGRQTTDDQMFKLANRYDLTVHREYLFLDNSSFQQASQLGLENIDAWLLNESSDNSFATTTLVRLYIDGSEIALDAYLPFAD